MFKRLLPLALVLASIDARAGTYNAFKDFHANTNPGSGMWVYGAEDSTNAYHRFTTKALVNSSLASWSDVSPTPFIRKNKSGLQVVYQSAVYPPKSFLVVHPGIEPAAKYAVVRFQAPADGNYTLDATFKSVEQGTNRATSDVWVDLNGSPFWTDTINGFWGSNGKRAYYNVPMLAGDTLDFVVGPDDAVPPYSNGSDDIGLKIVVIDDQDGDGIEDSVDTACPTAGLCAPDLLAGDLVITEIMYDPAVGADSDNEWVELYNTTTTSIDLNGADLRDFQSTTGAITASTVVPAGGRVVLANGTGANWAYDFTPSFFYGATPAIANQNDDQLFLEVGSTVIDGSPQFKDPTGGNGVAYVLSGDVLDSAGNDDTLNWCAADLLDLIGTSTDRGTPFDPNPVCP